VRTTRETRRDFLLVAGSAVGSGLILSACGSGTQAPPQPGRKEGGMEEEVTATEDLMREHGVLRRALLVYGAAAVRLRQNASGVNPGALQRTAKLFRAFGEDYHEKQLEEAFIFPAVKRAGGAAATLSDILVAQHTRGRQITDYILAATDGAKLAANAEGLARALEGFVAMYEHHAAREDTIVFPAWKEATPAGELHELAEKFEEIEHKVFGEDGFDEAVKQISDVEGALGLSDIAQFTAPEPPAVK
jgi:hemerythrin-like domain-containing protein